MRWKHLPNDADHCGIRALARAATIALLQVGIARRIARRKRAHRQTISFAALSGKTFGAAPFT